jgi:hypothetical protein
MTNILKGKVAIITGAGEESERLWRDALRLKAPRLS